MVPTRLFRSSAFSAGNAAIFAINGSLTGAIFLMPQFQQVVAGQDPLGAGLRLLPWGICHDRAHDHDRGGVRACHPSSYALHCERTSPAGLGVCPAI
jgi:hypothetical protein